MRDYVNQRVKVQHHRDLDREGEWRASVAEAGRLQTALWSYASPRGAELDPSPVPFGTVHPGAQRHDRQLRPARCRRSTGMFRRLVLLLLFGVFLITAAIVGFASGSGGHRPPAVSLVMVGLIVVLVVVILDLDRPRRGLIEVSKKSLYDLQASINSPAAVPVAPSPSASLPPGPAKRRESLRHRPRADGAHGLARLGDRLRCRARIAEIRMSFEHSPKKAAAWMSGWLTAMVVMAVAGREATQSLHVFQIMEMRSLLGLVLLYPLIRASGGFAAMRTARRPACRAQHLPLWRRSSAGSSR